MIRNMNMSNTDQKTYDFSAVTAGQFTTGIDKLMESVRSQAISQSSPPQTSEGKPVSANVLLIPIQVVQNAINEAHRLGFVEGEANGPSGADIKAEVNDAYEAGYNAGLTDGYDEAVADYNDGGDAA